AATTWADAPGMVVLAGNGHYDYLQANTAETNQLPPMLVQTPAGVCASDGLLADAGGDALPDVAIGRLPARTPAELTAMIAKIQAYEADFGAAWQNQISLAADPADAVGNFTAENDKLAALATDPYSVAARIDLDDMEIGLARTNFMDWFNAGAGFIHFTGHGDMKNLGKSNLLTTANVASMTNALRPPILVSLTCLAARFEYPSVSSLGEVLLQRAGGGAVAALGPSGLTRNAPASELGQAFYAAVFQEGAGRLGPAFLRARRALPASLFTEDTLAVYNLLGDPALRIAGNDETLAPVVASEVVLSNLSQTYDGTARAAVATTDPAGLTVRITYDGSAAAPTAAGTYIVAATVATAGYEGSTTGILTVAKAAATVSLGDLAQTYDGEARSSTATTVPAGLPVEYTYDGSPTPPIGAGDYAVAAAIADPNYAGSATGTLTVAKATAAVSLGDLVRTFDGTPQVVSASTEPAGLAAAVTYNGSAAAPTAAGTYLVAATVADDNYEGAAADLLVVEKAQAEIVLGNLAQTCDGTRRNATASTVPPQLAVDFTYDGSPVAPMAIGSYAVAATIADPNYSGFAIGTLVVSKGVATISLGDLLHLYDGSPKRATATTTPSGLPVHLTYDGWDNPPSAAGAHEVVATVDDSNFTGSATGTLTILEVFDPFEIWLETRTLDPMAEEFYWSEDGDGDGQTTWEEYLADTDPTNSASVFAVEGRYDETDGSIHMLFPSSPDRYYQLVYATNLFSPPIVRDLGWGPAGYFETNAPGCWFGTIRVRAE
ncbi:MAG: MBG domain-containing protein, partial [Kiritimatiellia bacterium]